MKLDALRTALATAETLAKQISNISEYNNDNIRRCDQNIDEAVSLLRKELRRREDNAMWLMRHPEVSHV